jgi:hypothetical protein
MDYPSRPPDQPVRTIPDPINDFGLTSEDITQTFSDCVERFAIEA